jgi:hypothetical protein
LDDSGTSWSSDRGSAWSLSDCMVASANWKHSALHSYACWYVGPTVMIPFGLGIFSFRYSWAWP